VVLLDFFSVAAAAFIGRGWLLLLCRRLVLCRWLLLCRRCRFCWARLPPPPGLTFSLSPLPPSLAAAGFFYFAAGLFFAAGFFSVAAAASAGRGYRRLLG
jgi:hypothetical protein